MARRPNPNLVDLSRDRTRRQETSGLSANQFCAGNAAPSRHSIAGSSVCCYLVRPHNLEQYPRLRPFYSSPCVSSTKFAVNYYRSRPTFLTV